MPGEPPKMIITDQDAAMSKAIVVTPSTTFHRYCIWEDFSSLLCLFELVDEDETHCRYKRSKVCKVASELIDSALLCDEGFELLEKSFEDIRGKLTTLVSSRAHVEEPNRDVGTSYPQLRIKYPHRVKVKGRGKRVKGEKENAVQRHKRRCTECRKTDHDRRSCPKLASPSSSSDTELCGLVGENLQPTQSMQDSEPTMIKSFMQEFDFITMLSMRNSKFQIHLLLKVDVPDVLWGLGFSKPEALV
ncbi:unnamed protein product [Prunus armeniaca]